MKTTSPTTRTKSGLMLGLGETHGGTPGDPGRPPVDRLRPPDAGAVPPAFDHATFRSRGIFLPHEFDELGRIARSLGFAEVASGPFVRSSYHADEMVRSE